MDSERRKERLRLQEQRRLAEWEGLKAQAEASNVDVSDLETGDTPTYLLPTDLQDDVVRCRFCAGEIRWGKTINGKPCPFDAVPPHANHWSTCERRDRAAAVYKR